VTHIRNDGRSGFNAEMARTCWKNRHDWLVSPAFRDWRAICAFASSKCWIKLGAMR